MRSPAGTRAASTVTRSGTWTEAPQPATGTVWLLVRELGKTDDAEPGVPDTLLNQAGEDRGADVLEQGQDLHSDVSGRTYVVVDDEPAGAGGFGIVWRGESDRGEPVALKLCNDRTTWAGEAYFGTLVAGLDRFLGAHDSIVELAPGRILQFVLVSHWIDGGTVEDQLSGSPLLDERSVLREMRGLLRSLAQVHRVGITHRDIKPANAYLRKGKLMIGDLGLSKQVLGKAAPAYFGTVDYSPPEHAELGKNWEPRDDIYMLGLLALSLLLGTPVTTTTMRGRLDVVLRPLEVSDDLKYWFWHAMGPREFRFHDAGEALLALSEGTPTMAPSPASLTDHAVVFTGKLQAMTRAAAARCTKEAGARVQDDVNTSTSVIVLGALDPRKTIGSQAGRKLWDAWLLAGRGQTISVVQEQEFLRLAGLGNA